MSRSSIVVAIAVLVALSPGTPRAEICSIDPVPGATLLLPYFEVDIGDAEGLGVNTVFTVSNAGPAPTIAHITLWTDWSYGTVDFDIFLAGYDTVTVDLFQVIGNGNLPVTADEQNDPADTISPNGGNPDWDGSFSFCADIFPFPQPVITGGLLDRVQNGHSGYPVPSLNDDCAGEGLNGAGVCSSGSCPSGTIARGFVTVDSANDCSLVFPFDADYFVDGGTGTASNTNNLWGEFLFLESGVTTAGGPLVAVEADDDFSAVSTPTGYTFYGRFTQGTGGVDNREPLGTTWTAQFKGSGNTATEFVVWRDPTAGGNPNSGWDCGLSSSGAGPDWAPLSETEVVCVDHDSNVAETLCSGEVGGSACFPLATQKVAVGAGSLNPSFASGWCYLNLNLDDSFPADVDFPPPAGAVAQSYIFSVYSVDSQIEAATAGTVLFDGCQNFVPVFGSAEEPVFMNGFESGDTSGWSSTRQ